MLYPIFLNLKGRPVLVVGAGSVALGKIQVLLSCGGKVRVIAPYAVSEVRELSDRGELEYAARKFDSSDVAGMALVIAATSDAQVNEAVMRCCHASGVWVNVVDDPPRCDFYVPSLVNRGRLHLAISTEGASPAFARRLRRELDHWLHESLDEYVELLDAARKRIRQRVSDRAARRSANEAILNCEARTSLEHGDMEGARAAIERVLARIEQKRAEA
ncbi:MAG: bifunctional precorrin-2 dehydrogenase/sirohydrochlorin ferrochelatase [Deltaproteobacteria bacterium]|nr:bifunctional precorrin-2 dehydrogenase/sirohydrochlorin ferrochelatase [Deltaproteobacteria bacterium]